MAGREGEQNYEEKRRFFEDFLGEVRTEVIFYTDANISLHAFFMNNDFVPCKS